MAERDTTPITVTLDRRRPYREQDHDRRAIWVGPGTAEVPRWVAEAWGMTSGTSEGSPPSSPPPAAPQGLRRARLKPEVESPLAGLGLTADQQAALLAAGYANTDALRAASDDELVALPTIGKATVVKLRERLEEQA